LETGLDEQYVQYIKGKGGDFFDIVKLGSALPLSMTATVPIP
jgi:hypothetical protein